MDFFKRELAKIRANRAAPSLIEDMVVDCFGQKLPLKQLANISLAGPRQLVVQPWDESYIVEIEKTVSRSNLGANVAVQGKTISISLPPLSQEFRERLLDLLAEKMEQARQTVRHWRERAWKQVQEKEKAGDIREDDKFRAKDELQKLVDGYNKKIEELAENKKREITE